jgi:hypothetical protein
MQLIHTPGEVAGHMGCSIRTRRPTMTNETPDAWAVAWTTPVSAPANRLYY